VPFTTVAVRSRKKCLISVDDAILPLCTVGLGIWVGSCGINAVSFWLDGWDRWDCGQHLVSKCVVYKYECGWRTVMLCVSRDQAGCSGQAILNKGTWSLHRSYVAGWEGVVLFK